VYENFCSDFIYYSVLKLVPKMISTQANTTLPIINKTDFSNFHISIPSCEEQLKISSFCSILDTRIETQKKTIQNLETLIKGVSQKLFTQKLRFKEFTDEWKITTLGEILVEQNDKTTFSDEYRVLSSTAKGLFYQSEYFNKEVASKDNSGYKILRKNQLVFSPQNLWLGNINVNSSFDIGIVSPSYKIFSFDENRTIINYCKYFLKTPKMMFEYEQSSEQGASVVRRNLNMELFLNIIIHLPSIKEQTKIADFLSKIS